MLPDCLQESAISKTILTRAVPLQKQKIPESSVGAATEQVFLAVSSQYLRSFQRQRSQTSVYMLSRD